MEEPYTHLLSAFSLHSTHRELDPENTVNCLPNPNSPALSAWSVSSS